MRLSDKSTLRPEVMIQLLQNHMNDEAITRTFSQVQTLHQSPMMLPEKGQNQNQAEKSNDLANNSLKKSTENLLQNGIKPRVGLTKEEKAAHKDYLSSLKERAKKI